MFRRWDAAFDDFGRSPDQRKPVAPDPFLAALPQVMLGRDGGALAVVGHVDRALGYSFVWPGAGQQTEVYRSTIAELGAGQPIGSALEYVGDRYAEIATDLKQAVDDAREGWRVDDAMLAGLFAACADARGFVLLGDPAGRLATVAAGGLATRTAPVTAATRREAGEPAHDISTAADRTEGHAIQMAFEPGSVFVDVVAIEEGPTVLCGSFLHQGELALDDEEEILAPAVERLKEL